MTDHENRHPRTNASTPTLDDSTPTLAAENVSHRFGDLRVLEDVSLSVEPGETVAVVGPNGSGKSTLLRFLAGVRTPDSGTVTQSAAGDAPGEGRQSGYLPQQPEFRAGFCLRDTLAFYAKFVEGADIDQTLDQVGLAEIRGQHTETLSGGQTRLLGLGRALLGDPPLLVLDEPASGLDPEMVERLFAIVSDIASSGRSVVLSSHNLGPVERVADRVLVLSDGRVVADGSPRELVERSGAPDLQMAFGTLVSGDEDEPASTDARRTPDEVVEQ
ncbi:ABC transporter ATP-binding protein [Haloferax namakaokahaiae]|uniref:ABC transporter ATP-binding protein n=1 Tax=Haloferax namakaokahaiae TaxID=1748331 RepID=A0ABD5ZGC9_9EURY